MSKHTSTASYKHRRESSLSTRASMSSEHSRVLPFATAAFTSRTLGPISASSPFQLQRTTTRDSVRPRSQIANDIISPPNIRIGGETRTLGNGGVYYPAFGHPRFALAQPRRVVTVNGSMPILNQQEPIKEEEPKHAKRVQPLGAVVAPRPKNFVHQENGSNSSIRSSSAVAKQANGLAATKPKRRSMAIGISSILPPQRNSIVSNGSTTGNNNGLGGPRARPIIGLGVTLNPADALVTLQPRRRRLSQPRLPSTPRPGAALSPTRPSSYSVTILSRRQLRLNSSIKKKSSLNNTIMLQSAAVSKGANNLPLEEILEKVSLDHSVADGGHSLMSPDEVQRSPVSLSDPHGSPRFADPELVSTAAFKRSTPALPPMAEFKEDFIAGVVPSAICIDSDNEDDDGIGNINDRMPSLDELRSIVTRHSILPSLRGSMDPNACKQSLRPLPGSNPDQPAQATQQTQQTQYALAPVELCCLLCFERVRIPKRRSQTMRCPGCAHPLSQLVDPSNC
ncbi:hypothetical protein LPJ66_003514 [Kickxella alabastrina]|uniref:Uncharacterized protein n=1 Tax=Kickxella alabastrina TaxID=61397 RepID=A0ACC1IN27_9FUNG|nr:hypothetical protein LPJ66_003514 [Kickxella alabastrina]